MRIEEKKYIYAFSSGYCLFYSKIRNGEREEKEMERRLNKQNHTKSNYKGRDKTEEKYTAYK